MNFAMMRPVVGCLCGAWALTAVACGDGPRIATSPTPGGAVSSAAANEPGNGRTAPGGTVSSAAGKGRPFKGSLSLQVAAEPVFEPPSTLSVHLTGTGNATHLGRFTATIDVEIDVSNEPAETSRGTLTFIAANRDSVFGTFIGHAMVEGEVTAIVETVTIIGGTGRFAGATGSFIINRKSLETELPPGSFDGTISY